MSSYIISICILTILKSVCYRIYATKYVYQVNFELPWSKDPGTLQSLLCMSIFLMVMFCGSKTNLLRYETHWLICNFLASPSRWGYYKDKMLSQALGRVGCKCNGIFIFKLLKVPKCNYGIWSIYHYLFSRTANYNFYRAWGGKSLDISTAWATPNKFWS